MPQHSPKTCKRSAVENAHHTRGIGGQRIPKKSAAMILVVCAYVFGGGGMLAWMAFIVLGPQYHWHLGLSSAGSLLVDTLLCLLFFFQHSLMVRRRFHIWLTRFVRPDFHGALYASVSGCCLLFLILFWQPVGLPLWSPPAWILWGLGLIILSALAVGWWGSRSLEEFDALGVKSALAAFNGPRQMGQVDFIVRGPFRWVRHPLYLISLAIIWAGPVFTVDRLYHNLLWSIWIFIGATLEEKDLMLCFGDAYREYRQAVPMLIPKSIRPRVPEKESDPTQPEHRLRKC
ncbi:MAG: hypothetical protein CSA23_00020 [Deltaproteobacteria bacterium]|nr:MAG: hypothetical protein CSA23_00020 [Deltaproteobacteria bacterium]